MAYNVDLVATVTQYEYNGTMVKIKGINHLPVAITKEVYRLRFTGKNVMDTMNKVEAYRMGEYFKYDLSVAMSEFGINIADKEYYILSVLAEKTAKEVL